ncbi:MAG TPA: aldehyde dehydrogenase family protein, partial [Streptosporangiaceae bacterium]|nr:aldehyde dehydrogenase family protein [Streptosporangiaceae bacterium]
MGLLDSGSWHGKIYSNGWVDGSGGGYPVTEPATGAELGRVGHATPGDVRAAARAAKAAQPSWAAAPYSERAAVLRRAGDLWLSHADEIKSWLSRETGAIPPLGDLQVHVSSDECYEAA